ncbi:FAD:protein FMN transferase [Elusimicrobiota bacterium]
MERFQTARNLSILFLLGTVTASCSIPAAPAKPLTLQGRTMGTTYHVSIAHRTLAPEQLAMLHAGIEKRLEGINKLMSTYDPQSEISRFNRSRSGKPFPVSPETAEVVEEALTFARDSGGAFDPTVGPLVDLWGFGPGKSQRSVPSDKAIGKTIRSVGHSRLRVVDGAPALIKDIPGLRVDLGAIAKGYGVDTVAALLVEGGFTDFMVEIGGEVVAHGLNPDGERWRIGIDQPADNALPGQDLSAVVPLSGAALATSGNYRNFFLKGGKRYSHFIDPKTGKPITHMLASVSVIAPTCMTADAAATTVMVLGPERGKTWIRRHPDWEAMLLIGKPDGTFDAVATKGFPDYLPDPVPGT